MNRGENPARRMARSIRQLARGVGRWTVRRVGRRGATLLLLALLDLIYAAALALPPEETRATSGYRYISALLPAPVWAAAWLTVGLVCLINSCRASDRVGFALAAALKAGWGLLYLAGWAAGAITRGWTSAAIWLAVAAWLLIVATWPEAPRSAPDRSGE